MDFLENLSNYNPNNYTCALSEYIPDNCAPSNQTCYQDLVDYRCYCNYQGYQFRQLTYDFSGNNGFQIYNLGSAFGSCWLAYVIYTYREFACHPMKLFMLIAVADASICFNQFFAPYACVLGLPKLMTASIFGLNPTPEN